MENLIGDPPRKRIPFLFLSKPGFQKADSETVCDLESEKKK
jgi:hypothetical protein